MDHLVAVYRDPETPRRVADTRSKRAEMEAEVQQSWGGALIGTFLTGEMLRGAAVFIAILVPLSAVVGAVAGLALFSDSSDTWVKLGVGALIGALFGFIVGALLGGGFAMTGGAEPLAAEERITVDIADPPSGTEEVMREFGAIRVDRFADDMWLRTESDEGPTGVKENLQETVREFRENVEDPRRR